MLSRLEAVERKLKKINIRGTVSEKNSSMGAGGCVRVLYGDNQLSDWLPVKPVRSGVASIWWFPDVGEGVTVTDIEVGEVLPGSYTSSMPPPTRDPDVIYIDFGDGGFVTHNRSNGEMVINTNSKVTINTTEANVNASTINATADTINATATSINSKGEWMHTGPMTISETLEVQAELAVLSTSQLVGMVMMPGGFVSGGLAVPGVPAGSPGKGTMIGEIDVTGEITINGVKVSSHKHPVKKEGVPTGGPF